MRPLFLRYLRTLQEWEDLLEQEQVLSAPSALARWTLQVSSFLTWNNCVLDYLTGKSVCSVWSCSWGMCFQVMGAGGQDCLVHSASKCGREPSPLDLQCSGGNVLISFCVLSLQVIRGLDLSFMPVIQGKMKDHLYFLILWGGQW